MRIAVAAGSLALLLALAALPAAEVKQPKFLLAWGQKGDKAGEFYSPIGLAINQRDEVYVTDLNNARLQKFTADGKYLGGFDLPRDTPARKSSQAGGIALDERGQIYLSFMAQDKVRVYTDDGRLVRECASAAAEVARRPGSSSTRTAWPSTAKATSTSPTPATSGCRSSRCRSRDNEDWQDEARIRVRHRNSGSSLMPNHITRRSFATTSTGIALSAGVASADDAKPVGPTEAAFERDYAPPKFSPSWKKPQINRTLVQDFVIYAHSNLEMVKTLLDKEPGLINATMDWGAGDWESGLGGASHMGRRDIVGLLLERGARIDIFCATMMGQLDAVKSFLTLQPQLIDAKGPHGFTLHFHAQVGKKESEKVLDYLQSIKKIELKPLRF